MLRDLLLAVAVTLTGCLDLPVLHCDDLVCPVGEVCTPGGCASPADVAACTGLTDGTSCKADNGGTGTCVSGACHTGLCGNGVVDPGEVCDDGNQVSGDGCRGDCGKIERCGDGAVDVGEACDDGNQNPADGCDACKLTAWNATAVVGAETGATTTGLANPSAIASDGVGRVYIADTLNHRIRRVELDGSITTVAGTGTAGYSGDGGVATSAQLNSPAGIAVDGVGRLFVSDTGNERIRRVEIDGTITTIAGTGIAGYAGDGFAAILAQLSNPNGVTVDGFGRIFIADADNARIRLIDIDGAISTVAGTGTADYAGDGSAATAADLNFPLGVGVDASGRLLIADTGNGVIRRVEINGTIDTIAGTGNADFAGDNGPAIAADLNSPVGVAVDASGRIVIADTLNQRIRRIDTNGTITTVAGDGTTGYGGDGMDATSAQLAIPFSVGIDGAGNIIIADTSNQRIRRIATAGTITTIAGDGTFGFGGDGGPATSGQLNNPWGVAVDTSGRIYIADTFNHRVRRVNADGTITTVAGTGITGFSGDGGPATTAQISNPDFVAIDRQGRVVFSDTFNQRVRRVELDGTITTLAGNGGNGYNGDGIPATSAMLANPNGVAVDSTGRVVFADLNNKRIRRIELDGTISTVAGNGGNGFGGDGGAATSATLSFPYGVAVDATDRIIIDDTGNNRVRRIESDGHIATIAGTGTAGYSGDGAQATSAELQSPYGVALDAMGRIYIADDVNQRIRRIALDGTISTLIGTGPGGNGTGGADGDAAIATAGQVSNPIDVAVDPMGRVVIADSNNSRIRRIEANGTVTTVAGQIDPDDVGPVATARLVDPQALVVGSAFTLVAGGTSGTLEAVRNARVDVVAGRYPQADPTGNLARFRSAGFGNVGGTAFDSATGLIYLTDTTSNRLHVVTQVNPDDPTTWTIATLANTAGTAGFSDGAAATAAFRSPTGLFLDDTTHTLYIADTGNHAIRALDLTGGTVSTVVNTSHSLGFAGDGGTATAALLYQPSAITRCANGDLFIADTGNNRIRRVASGVISTVLGDGVPASSGEGTPARTFPVDVPRGLACDAFGNLFATSSTSVRLLPATDAGIVDGSGPVQTIYGTPPRVMFPTSITSCLTGLATISATAIQITDACTGLLVELDRTAAP